MRLLVTHGHPTFERYTSEHLGRLVQPRSYGNVKKTAEAGIPWAADNDCFQGLDPAAYIRMLDAIKGLPGCLFVTVPDVVGDAVETAALFEKWAPAVARRGLPIALVAQDGLEDLPGWLYWHWHRLEALFIGGTTDWKLGPHARELVAEAKRRGKYVHMGRVNSPHRLMIARRLGCDSADGSSWSRWKETWLPGALAWLAEPDGQLELEIA